MKLGFDRVVHRFEKEDGTESEPLEAKEFCEKFADKLNNYDRAQEFGKMLLEAKAEKYGVIIE